MTIQDAIKSGKKFRRPIKNPLSWIVDNEFALEWEDQHATLVFDSESLLAEDWEVLICAKHQFITDQADWGKSGACDDCFADSIKAFDDSVAAAAFSHMVPANPEQDLNTYMLSCPVGSVFLIKGTAYDWEFIRAEDCLMHTTVGSHGYTKYFYNWLTIASLQDEIRSDLSPQSNVGMASIVQFEHDFEASNTCTCGSASLGYQTHSEWCDSNGGAV